MVLKKFLFIQKKTSTCNFFLECLPYVSLKSEDKAVKKKKCRAKCLLIMKLTTLMPNCWKAEDLRKRISWLNVLVAFFNSNSTWGLSEVWLDWSSNSLCNSNFQVSNLMQEVNGGTTFWVRESWRKKSWCNAVYMCSIPENISFEKPNWQLNKLCCY